MSSYRLAVKEKGRTVLPVGLQRECGFGPGNELIARALPAGGFVVESRMQILERIWSSMAVSTESDAVSELMQLRTDLDAARLERLESPATGANVDESNRRGAALLAAMGLE